jgi:hypothetical protein
MKTKLSIISLSAVIILAIVMITAINIQKDRDSKQADKVVPAEDTITTSVQTEIEDIPAETVIPLEPEAVETLSVSFANVRDVAVWEERVAAGTEGGVFTYLPEDSSYQFYHAGAGLDEGDVNCVLPLADKLYVGGENGLAEIDLAGNIEKLEFGFDAPVNALAEYDGTLLIGTEEDGLIAWSYGFSNCLLEVPQISAVVSADDQIWVATRGHGLYSFDGRKWQKRFLIEDSTALDYVTDLGYKFNRVYATTAFGLYVFDGGRWKLYNEEDGLLVCDLTAVDFSGWKIIVSTSDWGIYEIFEDIVTPKAWSEGMEVTALASNGNLTAIGTPADGIYIAQGGSISHVNPSPQTFTRPALALLP